MSMGRKFLLTYLLAYWIIALGLLYHPYRGTLWIDYAMSTA